MFEKSARVNSNGEFFGFYLTDHRERIHTDVTNRAESFNPKNIGAFKYSARDRGRSFEKNERGRGNWVELLFPWVGCIFVALNLMIFSQSRFYELSSISCLRKAPERRKKKNASLDYNSENSGWQIREIYRGGGGVDSFILFRLLRASWMHFPSGFSILLCFFDPLEVCIFL